MKDTNHAFYIAAQARVNPVVMSIPGKAKSAVMRLLAQTLGLDFQHIILSRLAKEDLGGIPFPSSVWIDGKEHPCVDYLLPKWAVLARHRPTLLFMDEMNQAEQQVQGSNQTWFDEPPEQGIIVGAINPPEKSTSGIPFSAAVTNRLCILQWERHEDEYWQGIAQGGINFPAPKIPVVPKDFLQFFGPKWGVLLKEFGLRSPQFWSDEAYPASYELESQPWASDRSWTRMIHCLAAGEAVGASVSVCRKMAEGCVGSPSREFFDFAEKNELPDPRAILSDPSSLKLPVRFDLARAVIQGVLGLVRNEGTPEAWEQGLDVLEQVWLQSREVAMSAHGAFWLWKPVDYTENKRSGIWDELSEATTGRPASSRVSR